MSETVTVNERATKRPWFAAVLALLVPGLGHVYIRRWARAILWFGLHFAATQFFLSAEALPESLSVEAFSAMSSALPGRVVILMITIVVLNVVDAYLMARRQNRTLARRGPDGVDTCPTCGKELDPDLDFCHWCTTEIEAEISD